MHLTGFFNASSRGHCGKAKPSICTCKSVTTAEHQCKVTLQIFYNGSLLFPLLREMAEKGDAKPQILVGSSIKQQCYLTELVTCAHHKLGGKPQMFQTRKFPSGTA